MRATRLLALWPGFHPEGRETFRSVSVWLDPLLGLASIAIVGDAVIELSDPYRIPPPAAHIVLPALLVVFLAYMLVRRAPAEAWLTLGVAGAALAEVNENSLDLSNVQLFPSFFNSRTLPLPVSPFDLLFVVATIVSLPMLTTRLRTWLRPPQAAALALIALLCVLGLVAIATNRPVYDTARDLRPLLVVPALLLLAAPALAEASAPRLARLVVGVAVLKALEGVVRMVAAVGVPHQGVHLIFYDTTNDVVVVLGMIVVVLTAMQLNLVLRAAALTLLALPLTWSFRRGVFVALAGLLLAALVLVRGSWARFAIVAASIACLGVAAGMNTVLTIASRVPIDRVAAVPVAAAGLSPSRSPSPPGPGTPSTPRPAPTRPPTPPTEAGDVDASNVFRLLDAENAIRNVAANPVFGLGPGTSYVVYDNGGQPNSPFLAYAKQSSHVGYLAIALKAGLIGLGLYAAMWALAVAELWRVGPSRERDVLLGALLLFALLNAVFPLVATIRPAVLLGLLLARIATRQPRLS